MAAAGGGANGSAACSWESCAAVCHNCATLDHQLCRCVCTGGGYGHDCARPCRDDSTKCGAGRRYANATACASLHFLPDVLGTCPAMCRQCTPTADRNCPVVYGPAAPGRPPRALSAATRSHVEATPASAVVLLALVAGYGLNRAP